MKQSNDFSLIDAVFKESIPRRLTYFSIYEAHFEDLIDELKRFIKFYFQNYFTLCDLTELIFCVICHIIYEFKDFREVECKLLFDQITKIFMSYLNKSRILNLIFSDIINSKCIYHKTVMEMPQEQHGIFVDVLRETRCIYLSIFLKRLLTIKVCERHSGMSSSNADIGIMRDVEESLSRFTDQGVLMSRRNDDNYSVFMINGTRNATCATSNTKDCLKIAVGLENSAVLLANDEDQKSVLTGHSMSVMDLSFSQDSTRLFSCSLDGTLKLWDTEKFQLLRTYEGHNFAVWSVASCPTKSNIFVSGAMDCSICLWDVHRDLPLRKMMGHLEAVKVTVFHECGHYVVSGGEDGMVRLWDVRSASCVRLWETKASGSKVIYALNFNFEAGTIWWGTESGLVESVSLEECGIKTQPCNIGEHVSGLVCRRHNTIVSTIKDDVFVLHNHDQVSKIIVPEDESGRLLSLRGSKDLGGPVHFIKEHV